MPPLSLPAYRGGVRIADRGPGGNAGVARQTNGQSSRTHENSSAPAGIAMEALNHALFLWINAPAEPAAATVRLAMFFAEYAIWLAPLALVSAVWSVAAWQADRLSGYPRRLR
ncbi:hypothetical protein ACQUWX_25390, partial [Ralstonia pseudosolanacearum]